VPLRMLEIAVPKQHEREIAGILDSNDNISSWRLEVSESVAVFHAVLPASGAEKLMDAVEDACAGCADVRMVLLPVEGAVPRIETESPDGQDEALKAQTPHEKERETWRVSREELYADALEGAELSPSFLALIALSAIVASVGLLRDNVAVVIGAMVIAPLFGPNTALAVGTTLGDIRLIVSGSKALVAGFALAFGLSAAVGLLFNADPEIPAIASRTVVTYADVTLALAAGAAATFAFTAGRASAVIGVMVAVALLPPITASGLLIGSGRFSAAAGSLLLTAVNVICINLAGVTAFVFQGVQPRRWWEAERAKKASRRSALAWALLLAALIVLLYFK